MKVLLCAASVALAVTACTNDEQQGVDINRPIGLNPMPTPAASVQTKAAIDATAFDNDDVIGLYLAWTQNATGETPVAVSLVKNTAWSNGSYIGEALYWQNTADAHTLYAYYPYDAQADNQACQAAVSIADNQNQATAAADYEAADVLWGKFCGKARNTVSLTLGHRMSLLTVSLQGGAGYADGETLPTPTRVELLGNYHLDGILNLADGTVTHADDSRTAQTLTAYAYGGNHRAILLPGENIPAGEAFIRITVQDGTTYTYIPEEPIATASDTHYDIALKLNKGSLTLTSDGISISPWSNSAPVEGDADMDIPAGNN